MFGSLFKTFTAWQVRLSKSNLIDLFKNEYKCYKTNGILVHNIVYSTSVQLSVDRHLGSALSATSASSIMISGKKVIEALFCSRTSRF